MTISATTSAPEAPNAPASSGQAKQVPPITPSSSQGGWKQTVEQYAKPHVGKAIWQIVNSAGLYMALWGVMCWTMTFSWPLTFAVAALSGLVLVRVFIIFHDCGHRSFFASRKANDIVGFFMGVLVWTPYHHWRHQHAIHHAGSGNLDKRGRGDVWTLTVKEYHESDRGRQIKYRIARNPFIILLVAPLLLFLVDQRKPHPTSEKRERRSVYYMNVALLAMVVAMSYAIGFWPFMITQLVVMFVAAGAGVWLFYVQHQYEDAYWSAGKEWDYVDAAIKGSGFLKLPRVLQWFSGNIGFHHIHHLSHKVPNYNLPACHKAHPLFSNVPAMGFWEGVKCLNLAVFDEESQKLIPFSKMKQPA